MGLPVNSLSDEELMHYAALDDEAAAEIARRSIRNRGSYLHEVEQLKVEVSYLENQLESAEEDSSYADDMSEAIIRVREILKDCRHMGHGQLMTAVEEVLDEISDF